MVRFFSAVLATLAVAGLVQAGEPKQSPGPKPQVEVVFCLDTTGSMSGLIDAAKQKIWSICNQIVTGRPTPELKVGLVAYRDRGDAYVTKVFDLTDDLDAVHANLMGFKAEGGGDFPESVNQALHDSVTKIKWSGDKKTLRIIFLVGDAPPHMDYKDDVKYPVTCKLACEKDIIINTVQCGKHEETKKYWLDICRLAEGSYVQIDDRGGPVVVVATPFDKELAEINTKFALSTLPYGDGKEQAKGKKAALESAKLPAGIAADRAGYYANAGRGAAYDLLENVKNKSVKLENLKDDQLPEAMRKLTLKERQEFLDKLDKELTELNSRARELDKKRAEFIARKHAEEEKSRPRDSFDGQVLQLLQRQATRVNVQYGTPEEKKK